MPSFSTYSKEAFREPLAVPPDPSLELLNFSTGVNSTPESEGVLFFSSIMSPSEEERLCLEVTGLLAGRGNTLDKLNDALSELAFPADSIPSSYNGNWIVNPNLFYNI